MIRRILLRVPRKLLGAELGSPPNCSRLGDLAVVARAVLRRALRRPNGFGAFQAVAFAAAAVGQRI